jgi:hypothetical protein
MTTSFDGLHPRGRDGTFAEKAQTPPAVALTWTTPTESEIQLKVALQQRINADRAIGIHAKSVLLEKVAAIYPTAKTIHLRSELFGGGKPNAGTICDADGVELWNKLTGLPPGYPDAPVNIDQLLELADAHPGDIVELPHT